GCPGLPEPRAASLLLRAPIDGGTHIMRTHAPIDLQDLEEVHRSSVPGRGQIEGKAMRRTLWRAVSMFVVSLALLGCNGPNRSQQPSSASGFHIDVQISPNALRGATAATNEAQGGCGVVTATVFDENGRLVDGATVGLATTLGRFPATNTRQESV